MANNFTIGQKMLAGSAALAVSTLIGTAYSVIVMRGLTSALSMASEVHELGNAVSASSQMLGLERAIVLHSIFDQKEEVQRYEQEFQKASQDLESRLQKLSAASASPESRASAQVLADAQNSWKSSHTELLGLLSGQKLDLAENLLKDRIAPGAEKMQKAADARAKPLE